jgi:hypothetical protein
MMPSTDSPHLPTPSFAPLPERLGRGLRAARACPLLAPRAHPPTPSQRSRTTLKSPWSPATSSYAAKGSFNGAIHRRPCRTITLGAPMNRSSMPLWGSVHALVGIGPCPCGDRSMPLWGPVHALVGIGPCPCGDRSMPLWRSVHALVGIGPCPCGDRSMPLWRSVHALWGSVHALVGIGRSPRGADRFPRSCPTIPTGGISKVSARARRLHHGLAHAGTPPMCRPRSGVESRSHEGWPRPCSYHGKGVNFMGISRAAAVVVFGVGLLGMGFVFNGCKDPGCPEEGLCAAPLAGCHFVSTSDPCGTCATVCDDTDGGDAPSPDSGDAGPADPDAEASAPAL